MICKLCTKDRDLCNSHIIPEYLHKPVYNEDKQVVVYVANDSKKNQISQKGITNKLLCKDCEQLLNKYEQLYVDFFDNIAHIIPSEKPDCFIIPNINYVTFKLFHMSILWRTSVTNEPSLEEIQLSPKHNEKMRKMILNCDPGEYYEYPCILFLITNENKVRNDVVAPISKGKWFGHNMFRFIFGGFLWNFIVSSHTIQFPYKELFLKPDNNLYVLKQEFTSISEVRKMAFNAFKTGKLQQALEYYNKRDIEKGRIKN